MAGRTRRARVMHWKDAEEGIWGFNWSWLEAAWVGWAPCSTLWVVVLRRAPNAKHGFTDGDTSCELSVLIGDKLTGINAK